MFNSLNSIETENKIQELFKYARIGIVIILPLFIIFLIVRGCSSNDYTGLENEMIDHAKKIITIDSVEKDKEVYIDLYTLEEQTEIRNLVDENGYVCDKASGVLVRNKNNKLNFTPYLICGNYRSKAFPYNHQNNYISLKGANTIIINANDPYIEPGYNVSNGSTVEIIGDVYSTPGLYKLEYAAIKDGQTVASVTRSVIVTENEVLLSQADQNKIYDEENTDPNIANTPVLSLKGEKTIQLRVGDSYVDPGASAFDKKDGDITDEIEKLGEVNTNKADTYTITYKVANSLGYQATVTRTIIVAKKETTLNISFSNIPSGTTKGEFTLSLQIDGNGYKYTVLPDNTKSFSRIIKYKIENNGTYNFYVYDINGNVSTKTITIDNIDNSPPMAACSAKYENGKTIVEVNNISNDITGYSYTIDGNYTSYINDKVYQFPSKALKVYVKVKDDANNIRNFSCDVIDKNPSTTPIGGSCDLSNITVTVKSCFGGQVLEEINFNDYIKGVVHGEVSINGSGNEEFLKAFIVFIRNFTINRGLVSDNHINIRSCSSDQNYCNITQGCYRYQTQAMFDMCMNFSMQRKGYYSPQKCANRVTTYIGKNYSINVNTVYKVDPSLKSNQYWDSSWPMQVTSERNTQSWHGPLTSEEKEKIDRLFNETNGLVIYDQNGKLAGANYEGGSCAYTTHGYNMCQGTAYELSRQGKAFTEIIDAFTQNYPNHKIACYKGKTLSN